MRFKDSGFNDQRGGLPAGKKITGMAKPLSDQRPFTHENMKRQTRKKRKKKVTVRRQRRQGEPLSRDFS